MVEAETIMVDVERKGRVEYGSTIELEEMLRAMTTREVMRRTGIMFSLGVMIGCAMLLAHPQETATVVRIALIYLDVPRRLDVRQRLTDLDMTLQLNLRPSVHKVR
jgi:hypothetical protein